VNQEYFLIRNDNWGSKIHIIWPLELQQEGPNSISKENLPITDNYATWCTERITGEIRLPTQYDIELLTDRLCENCMKKSKQSKHNPTPKFIQHINKSEA